MPTNKSNLAQDACIELDCAAYQHKGSSIGHGPEGATFRTQCGPLSDTDIAELESAARAGRSVRLVFPKSRILLSHFGFERLADGWVVLGGRIVSAAQTTEPEGAQPE